MTWIPSTSASGNIWLALDGGLGTEEGVAGVRDRPTPQPRALPPSSKRCMHAHALTFCAPRGQFFLRFTVIDECGIIADVGEECRRLNININSILQHPESGPTCNFVVVTEETDLDTVKDLMKNLQEGHSWFQSSFIALLHSKC